MVMRFLKLTTLLNGVSSLSPTEVSSSNPAPVGSYGSIVALRGTLTRPADTTAYTANDLVGATTSVSATNVIEITDAVLAAGEALRIERVRLGKSTNGTTNATFRLHFFNALPTLGVGDNGALGAITALDVDDMRNHVGYVDVTISNAGKDAADASVGVAVPGVGSAMTIAPRTGTSIWVVIQATAAYTPGSAEAFEVTVEGARG